MLKSVPVGPGTRVSLRFALKLASGELIDSTGTNSAEFVVGDGNLLPGFERAMFGMRAGESASLVIPSEQGFGAHNPDNMQMMKKSAFAPDLELKEGLVVSFADKQKAELPGVICRILEEMVEVDFNHPLAGQDLVFEVEVVEVEQVSNEILRTGQ